MNIRKRSVFMGIVLALFLVFYGTAKMNSQILVKYVVERTLIQKAPEGADLQEVRLHFNDLLASVPDKRARTDLLFRIAGELEKVQVLTPRAMQELLDPKSLEVLQ